MKHTDALQILSSGDFDQFLGTEETDQLDFKGAPYQLEKEIEKYELAKDVAAFANADGGVVVIGIATELSVTSAVEKASKVRPLSRGLVDIKQYRDVLSQRIHPQPSDLDIRFHPSANDKTRGLISIDVPKQPGTKRPFLVRNAMPDDTKVPGWLIGFPTRRSDANDPMTIEELHQQLRNGSQDPTLAELLESVGRIEELLRGTSGERFPVPGPLDTRAQSLIERVAEDDLGRASSVRNRRTSISRPRSLMGRSATSSVRGEPASSSSTLPSREPTAGTSSLLTVRRSSAEPTSV